MSDGGKKGGNGQTVVPNGPGQPVKDPQPKLFGEEPPEEHKAKLIRGVYPFDQVASALQKELRRGPCGGAFCCTTPHRTTPGSEFWSPCVRTLESQARKRSIGL